MKNLAIKQVAFFCVLVLGLAAVANADTFALVSSGGDFGHFNFTAYVNRTVNQGSSGYDRLQVIISAIDPSEGSFTIEDGEGTWTPAGYAGFHLASDSAVLGFNNDINGGNQKNVWGDWTTNAQPSNGSLADYGQTAATKLSAVDFPNTIGKDFVSPLVARTLNSGATPAGEIFSSWFGGWDQGGDNGKNLGVGATLATLYVPTLGAGFNPTAGALLYSGVWAFNDGANAERSNLYFVPEPGTLVLLSSALMGLLAYAWRKRK